MYVAHQDNDGADAGQGVQTGGRGGGLMWSQRLKLSLNGWCQKDCGKFSQTGGKKKKRRKTSCIDCQLCGQTVKTSGFLGNVAIFTLLQTGKPGSPPPPPRFCTKLGISTEGIIKIN